MKMKKLAAIIAAALVLATSAVCLTACGGDTNGGGTGTVVEDSTLTSLAGTRWDITGISVDGTVKSVEELEQLYGSELDMYFYFTDSTVTANLMGEEDTTDYTYSNGVLTIEGESTTIVGDSMTFVVDGQTIMLKKSTSSGIGGMGTGTVIDNTDTNSVISVDIPDAPVVTTGTLAGTTWDIIEVSVDGQHMTRADMEAAYGDSIEMYFYFTDTEVTSYLMGETETTDYTYSNGVVTIDGESCTISGDIMEFHVDGQMFKLQKR